MKRLFVILGLLVLWSGCRKEKDTIVRIETSLGSIRIKLYDETVIHRNNMEKLIREGFYNGILFHRVMRDFMIQAGDPESKGARPGVTLGAKDAGYTMKAEMLPQFFHKRGAVAAARESDNINPEQNSSGSHFYIVQGKVYTPEELQEVTELINHKRYTRLFNRFKAEREGEITRCQIAEDYQQMMEINRELSEITRREFEKVKLNLSDEQKKIYTTLGGTPHLDGEYTVFGEVVEGMEVVDRIAVQPVDENFRPNQDVVILKMEIE